MDTEGYGFEVDGPGIPRLLEDLRTMPPVGIERVARGWEVHVLPNLGAYHAAEKGALRAIESADLGDAWEAVQRDLLALTEWHASLSWWKSEHGDKGHHAQAAAIGAALAITAGDHLDQASSAALRRPLAEALPWLLGDAAEPAG